MKMLRSGRPGSVVLRWVFAGLALGAAIQPLSAEPTTVDQASFMAEMRERLAKANPDASIESAGALSLSVKSRTGDPATWNFDRIFEFCLRNDQARCDDAKATFIRGLQTTLADASSAKKQPLTKDSLRLIVRNEAYCVEIRKILGEATPPSSPIDALFAEGLCEIVMFDFPQTRVVATEADVLALGLDRNAARELARTQILATLPAASDLKVSSGNLVLVDVDDAPSLMLDDKGWQRVATRLGSAQLLVMVPGDNSLLALKTGKAGDMDRLKAANADSFAAAERGVSPLIYRWTKTGWQVVR